MERVWKAQVIPVIKIDFEEGEGTIQSPVRIVHQYWGLDGNLIATKDAIETKE